MNASPPISKLNCLLDRFGARLAIALVLLLTAGAAQAAEIYVDGVACQLADAIRAANSDAAQYGCAAGAGADTLILTRDLKLQLGDLPSITSDISIEYAGLTAQECGQGDPPGDTDESNDPTPTDDPNDNPPKDPTPTDDPGGNPKDDPTPTDDPNDNPKDDPTPTDDPNNPPSDPTPTDDPNNPPSDPTPTDDPNNPPSDPNDNEVPPNDPPTIGDPPDDPLITPTNTAITPPTVTASATGTASATATATDAASQTATATATVPGGLGTPSANDAPGIPPRCLHIVSLGENLYRIALQYDMSVRDISNFNKLLSDDQLTEGQELVIPYQDCLQFVPYKG